MSAESDPPQPEPEPTRALLLSQALETCIQAERTLPGSADQIIAGRPAWMRAELRRLLALASALDAVATNAVMSEDFRAAARSRLMRRIGSTTPPIDPDRPHADSSPPSRGPDHPPEPLLMPLAPIPDGASAISPTIPLTSAARGATGVDAPPAPAAPSTTTARKRRSRWLWRGAIGGILAAALAVAATLSASASSLPGQPLYGIKQATEELGVRFAPDDQARTQLLLRQANARLDETTQLLDQGRINEVGDATRRFDAALDRATTTYVVTIAEAPADADAPTTAELKAVLNHQQAQIHTLMASAPQPARDDLRQALVATERSRVLVADPKPSDGVAAGHGDQPVAAYDDMPSAATGLLAAVNGDASAPTRASVGPPSPRTATAAPPPVDLLQPRADVTPYVPPSPTQAAADAEADHHEVDAQRAMQAQGENRGAETQIASGERPPVDASRGRPDAQRVEHLQIPALAPAPAVAQVRSTSGPSAGGDQPAADDAPPDDAHGNRGSGQHDNASGSTQTGAPVVAEDPADDHTVTPSPNQNDTRGRVAVQPPPPAVAHPASGPDAGGHGGSGSGTGSVSGSGSGDPAQPGGSGPQDASALRATRDLAASARGNPSTGSPAPVVANVSVPVAPAQSDASGRPSNGASDARVATASNQGTSLASSRDHAAGSGGNTVTASGTSTNSSGGGSGPSSSGSSGSGGSGSGWSSGNPGPPTGSSASSGSGTSPARSSSSAPGTNAGSPSGSTGGASSSGGGGGQPSGGSSGWSGGGSSGGGGALGGSGGGQPSGGGHH